MSEQTDRSIYSAIVVEFSPVVAEQDTDAPENTKRKLIQTILLMMRLTTTLNQTVRASEQATKFLQGTNSSDSSTGVGAGDSSTTSDDDITVTVPNWFNDDINCDMDWFGVPGQGPLVKLREMMLYMKAHPTSVELRKIFFSYLGKLRASKLCTKDVQKFLTEISGFIAATASTLLAEKYYELKYDSNPPLSEQTIQQDLAQYAQSLLTSWHSTDPNDPTTKVLNAAIGDPAKLITALDKDFQDYKKNNPLGLSDHEIYTYLMQNRAVKDFDQLPDDALRNARTNTLDSIIGSCKNNPAMALLLLMLVLQDSDYQIDLSGKDDVTKFLKNITNDATKVENDLQKANTPDLIKQALLEWEHLGDVIRSSPLLGDDTKKTLLDAMDKVNSIPMGDNYATFAQAVQAWIEKGDANAYNALLVNFFNPLKNPSGDLARAVSEAFNGVNSTCSAQSQTETTAINQTASDMQVLENTLSKSTNDQNSLCSTLAQNIKGS